MSESKYHIGFYTELRTPNTDHGFRDNSVRYKGYNICQSSNGKVIAFIHKKEDAEIFVEAINKAFGVSDG